MKMDLVNRLVGSKVGRLQVLAFGGRDPKRWRAPIMFCSCDCGNFTSLRAHNVGNPTLSCGCLRREATTKHGKAKSPEHAAWNSMKQRCINRNLRQYHDYGGRGIKVCDRWLNDFNSFYADMGPRPSAAHSMDRIDNSKGYSPDNCRWATKSEQNSNKRSASHWRTSYENLLKSSHINAAMCGILGYGA